MDNGKSIRETRDIDVPLVARHFYHHAGWAQLLDSEFAGYEAIGVVGQIIPWNFPLLMLAWKIAPALAAGNTIVLKPAEFTPLTALCFAEIADEAGIPAGVINIVNGHGETGAAIVDHPDVDKIAFTGSTEVGRIIRKATAGSGKKLSLELGGKSPFIVYDDADLDSVVEGVVDAIWFNQGQVCCAGSRLLVQEGVAERLVAKLRARMEKLRLGSPLDKAVDMGAIVAPVQLERIRGLVQQGVDEGATMWQPSWACPTEGCFYPPTLFTDVAAVVDDRAGRDLRPRARDDDLPHAGGIGRAGEQHAVRARGERLDGEHQPRARHRAEDQGGRRLGELDEPVRRRGGLRRLPRERVWARGRTRGDVGVREARRREAGTRRSGSSARPANATIALRRSGPPHRRVARVPLPADRPHAEALHRRQAGAPRSGLHAPHSLAERGAGRRVAGGKSEGHPQRRRSGARGVRQMGARHGPQSRPDSVSTSPRISRRAREEFARAHRAR